MESYTISKLFYKCALLSDHQNIHGIMLMLHLNVVLENISLFVLLDRLALVMLLEKPIIKNKVL